MEIWWLMNRQSMRCRGLRVPIDPTFIGRAGELTRRQSGYSHFWAPDNDHPYRHVNSLCKLVSPLFWSVFVARTCPLSTTLQSQLADFLLCFKHSICAVLWHSLPINCVFLGFLLPTVLGQFAFPFPLRSLSWTHLFNFRISPIGDSLELQNLISFLWDQIPLKFSMKLITAATSPCFCKYRIQFFTQSSAQILLDIVQSWNKCSFVSTWELVCPFSL